MIEVAKSPAARARHLVGLALCSPGAYSRLSVAEFPWVACPETGQVLVHKSSIPLVMAEPEYVPPTDPVVVRFLHYHKHERAAGIEGGPGRVCNWAGNYPWASLFPAGGITPLPYQCAGMERLWVRLRRCARGVLLTDDVGMGKTLQLLGLVAREIAEGLCGPGKPAVLLTQSSLLSTLAGEAKALLPNVEAVVVRGSPSEKFAALGACLKPRPNRPAPSLVVLSYEEARGDRRDKAKAVLASAPFVGLDEGWVLKNPESVTVRVLMDAFRETTDHPRPRVVILNATPIEVGLRDAFSQVAVADPLAIGEPASFAERYLSLSPYGQERSHRNLPELKERLATIRFGRSRVEVGEQSVQVQASVRRLEMSRGQTEAYLRAAQAFGNSSDTGVVGLNQLGAVARALFAESISDPGSSSCKTHDLIGLLGNELRGRLVLAFTGFATVAASLHHRLRAAGFASGLITGDVPMPERDALAAKFRAGSIRVLVGTSAMQRGLNLQAASAVVNVDLPWTASALRQRVGRADRLGQSRQDILVVSQVAHLYQNPSVKTTDDHLAETVIKRRVLTEKVVEQFSADDVGLDQSELRALRRVASMSPQPPRV